MGVADRARSRDAAKGNGALAGIDCQRCPVRHGISLARRRREVSHVPNPHTAGKRRGRPRGSLAWHKYRHQRTYPSRAATDGTCARTIAQGGGTGALARSFGGADRHVQAGLGQHGGGLIAADREGRFLIFNDAAHNLMGRGPEDLPTERWTQHYNVFLQDGITPYPPDRLPLVRALHGESVQVELIVELPETLSKMCLEVTARPIKDARGNLCGGVAVLRDITERKRSES